MDAANNRGYSSWWYWRRSGAKRTDVDKLDNAEKTMDSTDAQTPVGSPNITFRSDKSIDESCDKYRKTLRLTSEQIVSSANSSGCGVGYDMSSSRYDNHY